MLLGGPGSADAAELEGLRVEQLDAVVEQLIAVVEVDHHMLPRVGEQDALHARTRTGGECYFDLVGELHAVVARTGLFVGVGEARGVVGRRPSLGILHWHEVHIAIIAYPGTAEVGVAEAVNQAVAVMIAAAAVPAAIDAGVGRQLHHAKRCGRARKGMAVPTRADERVHEGAEAGSLGDDRGARQQEEQCRGQAQQRTQAAGGRPGFYKDGVLHRQAVGFRGMDVW